MSAEPMDENDNDDRDARESDFPFATSFRTA